MSQEIKYTGSFADDTGLNNLWSNIWNTDPTKWLPPNEAERQLMSAKSLTTAGQNEFIDSSIHKLGGQKRTPTTMFTTPQQNGVGFGINPNQSTGTASTVGLVNSGTSSPQYMPQDAAWKALVDGTSQMPAIPANDPVRMYQSANGLVVDGKVGPNTYNSMLQSDPALAAQYKNSPYLSGSGSSGSTTGGATDIPQFSSMYVGDPSKAYTTEALALQTAPSPTPQGGEGFWSGLTSMFDDSYLKNADGSLMTDAQGNNVIGTSTGDKWGGLLSGVTTGLNAYGMFEQLGQMDTRLDQGQQALNLSRDEYEENLRHRNAIAAQNRGA